MGTRAIEDVVSCVEVKRVAGTEAVFDEGEI